MKKIVFTHHITGMGGASISFLDDVRMLTTNYEVVTLIPENSNILIVNELNNLKVKIRTYSGEFPQFPYFSGSTGAFSRSVFTHWKQIRQTAPKIVKIIQAEDPDIIINNTIVQHVLGTYLQNLRCKKILYIRETFNENWVSRYIIRIINRNYDGIIGISPYENKYAQFKKPFCVVADIYPSGKEQKRIDSKAIKKNGMENFEILYMGGFSLLKGIDVLTGCIPYLEDNIKVTIVGSMKSEIDGANKLMHPILTSRLQKAKKDIKKFCNKIDIKGFTNEISPLMKNASLVVFPSTKPHQPRPVIEAGFYNKTAVISGFKQTDYFYKNCYNVLTFKPGSSKDLAKKINLLYLDKKYLKKLSNNNQYMTKKHHSFSSEQKKIIAFINSILE